MAAAVLVDEQTMNRVVDFLWLVGIVVGLGLIVSSELRHAALLADLDKRVVGRTPEGFHRADALELCEALADVNGLVCPSPYELPRYLDHPMNVE